MALFFSAALVFIGAVFAFIGYNIAIKHSYNAFISNFDRDKLRYKDAEAHARRMGWIDLIVGSVMMSLGVASFIIQNETIGTSFLAGSVVVLFLGLIINDNIGLK